MESEFTLRKHTSLALKTRCQLLNQLDKITTRYGGTLSIPGDDLDDERAFFQFRNFKDILDKTLKADGGYRRLSSHTVSLEYFRYMLPGIKFEFDEKSEERLIDPEYVIGCSWRGHLPPANPDEIMQKLNSATRRDNERAKYVQIEDLPLHIALEGQNRVELFRRHGQNIKADVRKLYITRRPVIVRDSSGKYWLATWPNEHGDLQLATVPFPTLSMPMYRLLGIEIHTNRLPVNESDVRESISASIKCLTEAVAIP
jgi:hypothetical protein